MLQLQELPEVLAGKICCATGCSNTVVWVFLFFTPLPNSLCAMLKNTNSRNTDILFGKKKKKRAGDIFGGGIREYLTYIQWKPLGPEVPSLCFLLYPCARWASHHEERQTLRTGAGGGSWNVQKVWSVWLMVCVSQPLTLRLRGGGYLGSRMQMLQSGLLCKLTCSPQRV